MAKKIIDWTFSDGMHTTTFKETETGEETTEVGLPIIYDYRISPVVYKGVEMQYEDLKTIVEKEVQILNRRDG